MEIVVTAFGTGQRAEDEGHLQLAIHHYNTALNVFHSVGGYKCNPIFWSKILFSRAGVFLKIHQYEMVANDIKHALNSCPQQQCELEEAELWFQHAMEVRPSLAIWCLSASLHFAAGETFFQSQIYTYRALYHHKLCKEMECDQDLEESKKLDIRCTWQTGVKVKTQAIEMVRNEIYDQAVVLLQFAEKIFRPPYLVGQSLKSHWNESQKYIILALWSRKMYAKAIQAGKTWQQMEHITSKQESVYWKEKGNEIFKQEKYDTAIDCYTLAINYAPVDDADLQGTLYSNRSQAYLRKKKFMKAKDDAEKCLHHRPNWSKGFYRLGSALMALNRYDRALVMLKKGLSICQSPNEKYEIFQKIMTLVFNCKDGPKKITFELPSDFLSRYLKECVQKNYWKSLEVFLLGGGGPQSYVKGEGGIATNNCDLKEISLCDVIKSNPKPNMYYKLINVLIDHGVLVNGRNEKETPLLLAVNYDDHDLAHNLLRRNANPGGLIRCKYGKPDDTPIHTAFRLGLSSGHWEVFHYLMETSESPTNTATNASFPEILDRKGNSLYHVFAFGERSWDHAVEGINLLKKYKVDPTTRNKDGKTPLMTVRKNNDKCRLIEECIKSFAPDHDNTKKKKRRKKKTKHNEKIANSTQTKCKKDENANQVVIPSLEEVPTPAVHCPTEIESLREKISQAIQYLPSAKIKNETRESDGSKEKSISSEIDQLVTNNNDESASFQEMSVGAVTAQNEEVENKMPLPAHCLNIDPLPEDNDEVIGNGDVVDDTSDVTFDKLTWEVECTSEVWKKLKDKKLARDKKRQIVNIIRQLANGDMRGSRAKRLTGIAKEKNILLFEAKLDRSARIIWERAIAFSPRCSENTLPDNKNEKRSGIYTEVIRIWDIVFDHDTVPRKIKKIIHSINRGTSCFIKKNLKGAPLNTSSLPANNDHISIPNIYVPREDTEMLPAETNDKPRASHESSKLFFPPGSPEETEYHILKFYEFSNAMVDAMLDNQNKTNLDFPFRVSELEHSVINLMPKPMTSILLLGRSGTGKTTCCLYRLWNNYQTYWQDRTLDNPSIPNVVQFIPRDIDGISDAESDEEDGNEVPTYEERNVFLYNVTEDHPRCSSQSFEKKRKSTPSTEQLQNLQAVESLRCEDSCSKTDKNEDLQATGYGQTLEHLHQAFITKNAVLCKEVKKNFLELSHASFSTRDDVNHHQSSSVYRFDQLEEQAWPLFICSRDWLLMLDASLPGKPFFPRDEDGKPNRTVRGWGEDDNNLHEIPRYYSEDEDDDDDETESKPTVVGGERHDQRSDGELDPRREVTYHLFKNELWKIMTKKSKVDYHPSLVWTEIISFIKGSVEALHSKNGYITLEDYQDIGNKRAPSFTADRETIYKLFLAYERLKDSLGMFDEADVVNCIYHRLEHNIPTWSLHEIYVDETQDFTQAELSVIIRSCRNPNRLFFTGDTAQSIMRGIAFRFSDLRSLFFYIRESVKAVGEEAKVVVPDRIYELTHNYRSHAGILNLASSVTDLLSQFFPESFDRLARDQGLFDGPKPVLLESCSFSDLAVILRGHKRKTSPIEFGAHQVILVASDDVRNSLPEELSLALVMTIYEAKGLEFDDVLIYNFFKDSQALKEWRVVGTYEEKESDNDKVSATGIAEIPVDGLKCKARPLEFNPNQHKILISEFKYLYTALTRARVNVWLFDESEEARAPMFEYFQKRGVVDVKQVLTAEDDKASLEGMFAQASGKEDWKKQGLFFYGKGLWKVASKCFELANEELWKKKCNAHDQAANAASLTSEPRKLKLEFLKAADLFLECEMKEEAAKCLYNARERILLAQLHEKCCNFLRAAKIFQKDREFLNAAARNFERAGDFERAVDCLLKINNYAEVLNVVSRYEDLMKIGQQSSISKPLRFDQRAESISYQAAKFHQKRGDLHLMKAALGRLPNVEDRITFLQRNGCFDQAAELLLKEGKAQEAARLMRSNGKFLEAARFCDGDKFVADCYLLIARSTVLSKKNSVMSKETEELIEGPLERAAEFYETCNNVNGQAEVNLARGIIYGKVEDLEEAGQLYYQASNYAALAETFLLLLDIHKKDPKKIHRPKAISTLRGLLGLILALYKDSHNSSERTSISMCYVYFGLTDTSDAQTKKVPRLEMVRFSDLPSVETIQEELIPTKEAEELIKKHLVQMARNLIKQLWNVHQQIIESCTSCPRFIAGSSCYCDKYHGKLRRDHFGDRFYALLFLVHLEDRISKFLKEMKRESAKEENRLRKLLFTLPEFRACQWLCELLYGEQLVTSHFLSQHDVSFLRQNVSARIIEYARSFMWRGSEEKERWSSSNLFIDVSNLMHIAGAPVGYVYDLLSVEEKKFENAKVAVPPGVFRDRRNPGCFNIFSRALERSKSRLYSSSDVQGSIHAAIKDFLFPPAKIKGLPYPSIANAVMILERQLTVCLVLYARLMLNETVCLPVSYLSMINFWDIVDRPKANRSTTLYHAIHFAPNYYQGPDGQYKFVQLKELARSMVALTVGQIWWKYNILNDALGDTSVHWLEAERVLVLVLTMLCNCGGCIPEECERIIREQILMLQLRQDLPQKVKKCIEDVRSATGVRDVVASLRELLHHETRQEKLCDVNWDDYRGKDFRSNCDIQRFSKHFSFDIDVDALLANNKTRSPEEQEAEEDEVSGNYPQLLSEEETRSQHQEYNEEEKAQAELVIQRALLKWKRRKEKKANLEREIKNDAVKYHFQSFRLNKSGCTICVPVQFVERNSNLVGTTLPSSSLQAVEEMSMNWPSRSLQRNTFKSHCAGGSPHWKKEKFFAEFKLFYKEHVLPTVERTTKLKGEMNRLRDETEVECSFDLDRLEVVLNRLLINIKKVEESRSWDAVHSIRQAAEEVSKMTQDIEYTRSRKGVVKSPHDGVNQIQDSSDEDFADGSPLKAVSDKVKRKNRNVVRRRSRKR